MHYGVLVHLPADSDPDPETAVSDALGYFEHKWDWFQIGGRWTWMPLWPTEWKARPEDVIRAEQLTDEQLSDVAAVVVDGEWYARERWTPWKSERFEQCELPTAAYLREQGGRIAIVDCHN
jgi:hypothetical protein